MSTDPVTRNKECMLCLIVAVVLQVIAPSVVAAVVLAVGGDIACAGLAAALVAAVLRGPRSGSS